MGHRESCSTRQALVWAAPFSNICGHRKNRVGRMINLVSSPKAGSAPASYERMRHLPSQLCPHSSLTSNNVLRYTILITIQGYKEKLENWRNVKLGALCCSWPNGHSALVCSSMSGAQRSPPDPSLKVMPTQMLTSLFPVPQQWRAEPLSLFGTACLSCPRVKCFASPTTGTLYHYS